MRANDLVVYEGIIIKLSQSFLASHIYFYVKNKNQYLSDTHMHTLKGEISTTKTFNFCKTIHEKKCDDSYKKIKTPELRERAHII